MAPAGIAKKQDRKDALNVKKAQLQLLEMELSEVDAKLDAEFIEKIPTILTTEEKDMRMEDDIRPFLTMIEQKREDFYREKLSELKNKVDTIKGEVNDEEQGIMIDDAKDEFVEAHPEADFNAINDFYHNQTTKNERDEIYAQTDHFSALEKAYEFYLKKNKKEPQKQTKTPEKEKQLFPPNLHNIPSSPAKNPVADQKDDAYLARIGLRKK